MNRKKRNTIAVIIGGMHTEHPQRIVEGIRDAARELDVNVYFFIGINTKGFLENLMGYDIGDVYDYQFSTLYDYSLLSGMDGIIISYGTIGVHLEKNDLNQFVKKFQDIPSVILTENVTRPNSHSLISDNYQGICMVMDHLIREHGYQKIVFVSGPENNTDARERRQAYIDAMKEAELPCDASMIAVGDYYEFVDAQVEQLLDAHPDTEAIVFANDEMALAGYRVCEKRGLIVGEDIAITGYDDCQVANSMVPPLTTVVQDGFAMGQQAVRDLVCRFEKQAVDSKRMSVKLVRRESCGCTPLKSLAKKSDVNLQEECRVLTREVKRLQKEAQDFQRRAWFVPHFARDLSNYVEDEEAFCRQIMVNLRRISSANAFLFLLKNPLQHREKEHWAVPKAVYLASYHKDGEVGSYAPGKRPKICSQYTMKHILNGDRPEQYTFFLLFSNEKQYGLLACNIEQKEYPFFNICCNQLGLSLRYHEVSRNETENMRKLSLNMEQMIQRNHELDIISGFDELTGLLNLRGFMEQAKNLRPIRGRRSSYMIYGDLDHLKEINDNWGHSEGDYAICCAGQILKKSLREHDIIGRIGGDEFVALVSCEADSFQNAFRERVRNACEQLNSTSGKPYYVEISIGIAPFDFTPDTNIKNIVSQADSLLYEHKKRRRKSIRRDA